LKNSSDSIERGLDKGKEDFSKQMSVGYLSIQSNNKATRGFIKNMAVNDKMLLVDAATNSARNAKNMIDQYSAQFDSENESINTRGLEIERKFTFPFACLLLFFIGAPLGAIIKKGGLGLPVVVAALFFVMYYILTILGMKSAKELAMSVFMGSWMPSFILIPIAVFLTYKAAVDSSIFDRDAYLNFFKKLGKPFRGAKV
jgi:lipopolysaccharide export system permease protein